MDFVIIKDFLLSYSLPTVIIALSVSAANMILSAFLQDKFTKELKGYFPFFVSILVYLVYDAVTLGEIIVREEALYAGVISGSFSALICSAANKLARGQSIGFTPTTFLIEGLLKNYIDKDKVTKTALTLDNLIAQNNDDDETLIIKVVEQLKLCSSAPDSEITKVAYLIIETVKSLNQ
ncbi:MAG: hypothetical protein E7340_00130 [Clostridiales bacterium]|nr:hypothetical protein [Clostridiales bacterium]